MVRIRWFRTNEDEIRSACQQVLREFITKLLDDLQRNTPTESELMAWLIGWRALWYDVEPDTAMFSVQSALMWHQLAEAWQNVRQSERTHLYRCRQLADEVKTLQDALQQPTVSRITAERDALQAEVDRLQTELDSVRTETEWQEAKIQRERDREQKELTRAQEKIAGLQRLVALQQEQVNRLRGVKDGAG